MIIKGGHILASQGHKDTADHIFEGPKNEAITALQGNPSTMEDMVMDARVNGLKYGFHHFKISPEREISRDEAFKDFNEIATEYGFNLADAVIVEHKKPRTKKENSDIHWHMIVPHYNQKTGRALDCRNSYKRNEKLSRLSELRTGQTIIQGRHNRAVFHALKAEGKEQEAQAIQHITEGDLPGACFSTNTQRKAERKGINLPEEKQAITDIWKASDGLKAFIGGLNDAGYDFKKGDKKDTYIIEKEGTLIGSVNRLLKMKKGEFAKLYQEMEDLKNVQLLEERTRNQERGNSPQDARRTQKNGEGYQNPTETENDTTRPGEETRTNKTPTATRGNGRNIEEGEERHEPNLGPFGATTNGRPARPHTSDSRRPEHNHGTKQANHTKPESHIKSLQSQTWIRARFDVKKHKDNSHLSLITPEYMENIKEKLKDQKNGHREFFRQQYKNIKEQEYNINKFNNSIDVSVSLTLIDMFLRLFGYTVKKQKPTPEIKKPDVIPPISKEDFDKLNDQEKQQITWKSYGLYKSAHARYASICEKHNVKYDDFQTWLNGLGDDFMSEQIVNLYPSIYMKELDKSENEDDKETLKYMKEIMKGEGKYSDKFTFDDMTKDIETIKSFISDDLKIKKIRDEWYKIHPTIPEKSGDQEHTGGFTIK